jgi:hypothetical protein
MKAKWIKHVSREVRLRYLKSDKGRVARRKTRNKRREYIFNVLGDKCQRCKFSDKRALQLDHINGRNGVKRLGNIDQRYSFIKKNLKEAKKIFQVLCANCNFIKREENNEHFYHGRNPLN